MNQDDGMSTPMEFQLMMKFQGSFAALLAMAVF